MQHAFVSFARRPQAAAPLLILLHGSWPLHPFLRPRPDWEGAAQASSPPPLASTGRAALFPVATTAASDLWPLSKPECSLGGTASHTYPELVCPLDALASRPQPLSPLHPHLLPVCWLRAALEKHSPTSRPGAPAVPTSGMQAPPSAASQRKGCRGPGPSGQHSLAALPEAADTEANARLVTVPKRGHLGLARAQPPGPTADLPSSYICWLLLFCVLKGHCSGCGLPRGVARKIWGSPGVPSLSPVSRTPLTLGPAFTPVSCPEGRRVP